MLGREGVWELLCLADSEGVIWPLVEMTTCIYVTGNGNPLQYSCLENPMDRGAWRVHGVTRVGHDLVTKPPQGGSSTDKTEVHLICLHPYLLTELACSCHNKHDDVADGHGQQPSCLKYRLHVGRSLKGRRQSESQFRRQAQSRRSRLTQ